MEGAGERQLPVPEVPGPTTPLPGLPAALCVLFPTWNAIPSLKLPLSPISSFQLLNDNSV